MSLPVPASDRTALVTGASSGIGTEIARLLARRGHGVTLVARREDRLRELADELAADTGVRAEVIAADLADIAARNRLIEQLDERGLGVSILVNNAGFSTMGSIATSDAEREVEMVRTDVEAVVHLCSALVPGMVERGSCAVINVASTAAFQPVPLFASYSATKAFVLSLSEALAEELEPAGIHVMALCPGVTQTGFQAEANVSPPGGATPDEVAKYALSALDRQKRVAIHGVMNTLLTFSSRFSPRSLVAKVAKKTMEPWFEGQG